MGNEKMTIYKCRGYSAEQKRWVTGYAFEHEAPLYAVDKDGNPYSGAWYIIQTRDGSPAINREVDFIQVEQASIGMYTAQHSINGLAIFLGDILESDTPVLTAEAAREKHLYSVIYDGGCFWLSNGTTNEPLFLYAHMLRIAGNAYENPDMATH